MQIIIEITREEINDILNKKMTAQEYEAILEFFEDNIDMLVSEILSELPTLAPQILANKIPY